MKNILTIDVEDWYQSSLALLKKDGLGPVPPTERVVHNTSRLLAILAEYDVHATCFVLGTVAEAYPGLVRMIHGAGHEIATHGYGHELVYRLTPDRFRGDLARSIDLLENVISAGVHGYRAPYFSITRESRWALDVLAELGLAYDSSIFPIRRGLYGFPGWEGFPHRVQAKDGCSLMEFPISTVSFLGQNLPAGGGGYFRILPYALIRWAIRRINRHGQPAIFYLHPYELDAEELKSPLPAETARLRLVRLSQGLNRSATEGKLRRLLRDFEFTSVKEWMAQSSVLGVS